MARYIDAETLVKTIRAYADLKHTNGETWLANGILKSLSCIGDVPTADVKPVVRGEWDSFTTNAYVGGKAEFSERKYYRCSVCGKGNVVQHNFCPSCGADMRKDKE